MPIISGFASIDTNDLRGFTVEDCGHFFLNFPAHREDIKSEIGLIGEENGDTMRLIWATVVKGFWRNMKLPIDMGRGSTGKLRKVGRMIDVIVALDS